MNYYIKEFDSILDSTSALYIYPKLRDMILVLTDENLVIQRVHCSNSDLKHKFQSCIANLVLEQDNVINICSKINHGVYKDESLEPYGIQSSAAYPISNTFFQEKSISYIGIFSPQYIDKDISLLWLETFSLLISNTYFIEKRNMIIKDSSLNLFCETYHITSRQKEVLQLILNQKHDGDISLILNIQESTVRAHVRMLLLKTGSQTRINLIGKFYDYITNNLLKI